ncbi:MAG TPA: outer membrane beta-barrel protein, partial [Candidatus Saccharimonadales bacterium]|nr:outer membrane beta-barrel protein [Candidatus Saccharimonadales bacterium]
MKVNKWTLGLATLGLVSLPGTGLAEEKMNQMWTALSSTTISGYVNTSIHWNTGTGNGHTPAFSYNGSSKQDGFNLNAVKLAIEKPLDEAQWAAGYKAELLFGPDAVSYLTTLDGNTLTGGDSSAAAIKQAYVALRAPIGNGLDFKLGVFDTIVGYEVFDGGNNPNYTRSYGFTIEPTTHTGLLGTYQLCKAASVSAGIANTHGPFINQKADAGGLMAESYKTYMGSLALTAPDDWGSFAGSTAYFGVVNGLNTVNAGPAIQTS